jgi:hypothetical protein
MRASLGRAGLIGHVDGTIAAAPTDADWATSDYTILNVMHAAIDEDVADMVLARDQTARQLWLAVLELFSANKAAKRSTSTSTFANWSRAPPPSLSTVAARRRSLAPSPKMILPSPIARSSSTLCAVSALGSHLRPP